MAGIFIFVLDYFKFILAKHLKYFLYKITPVFNYENYFREKEIQKNFGTFLSKWIEFINL